MVIAYSSEMCVCVVSNLNLLQQIETERVIYCAFRIVQV